MKRKLLDRKNKWDNLLDKTDNLFLDIELSDSVLIGCQHLLESNLDLFKKLFERGLKQSNTFVIGKCYSTHSSIVKAFTNLGVYVDSSSSYFDSHLPFDIQFAKNIELFVNKVLRLIKRIYFEKIIILDDGGYLISQISQKLKGYKILAVEQTSSGYWRLVDSKVNFPIINAARSHIKLEYESPLIAQVWTNEFRKALNYIKSPIKRILIIGGGSIGTAISNELKNKYIVRIYDTELSKSSISNNNLDSILKEFDVIIGCTGRSCISIDQLQKLKEGIILASASSSDREFPSSHIRSHFLPDSNSHKHIYFKRIWLLNNGFPLNFYGGKNSLPKPKAQLTRSIMLASIYYGLNLQKTKTGFIKLPREIQDKIFENWTK